MSTHFRVRVSLIVRLTDSFTQKSPNTSQIHVFVEKAAPPVQKKGGYYIFTNLERDSVAVTVISPEYQQVTRHVVLSKLDWREPFLEIRLQPARLYPNGAGATVVYGRTQPFRELSFAVLEESVFYRLLSDCESDFCKELTIFHLQSENLEGRSFLMWQKETKTYEIAQIGRAVYADRESYLLEKPLEYKYKKTETKLYPLHVCNADEKGNYFLLLPIFAGEKRELMCVWQADGKQENIKFEIFVGKENQKDL